MRWAWVTIGPWLSHGIQSRFRYRLDVRTLAQVLCCAELSRKEADGLPHNQVQRKQQLRSGTEAFTMSVFKYSWNWKESICLMMADWRALTYFRQSTRCYYIRISLYKVHNTTNGSFCQRLGPVKFGDPTYVDDGVKTVFTSSCGANLNGSIDYLKGYTNVDNDNLNPVKAMLRFKHLDSFCAKSELLFPNRISVEHDKEVSHRLLSLKVLHIVPVKVHDYSKGIIRLTELIYEYMNRKPGYSTTSSPDSHIPHGYFRSRVLPVCQVMR